MAISDSTLYRTRDEIVALMVSQLVAAIPDAYVGEDGVATIIFQIEAGQLENLYLANQLLLEDMFVHTANYDALLRHGEQYGFQPRAGTQAEGEVTFQGAGGIFVPVDTEIAYDPGGGLDVVYFKTTTDGTIPDPGLPSDPTAVVNTDVGNLDGTYEYVITFVNTSGETLPSSVSNAVNPASEQVDLSDISIGGAGTTARNIYRSKNGDGVFRFVDVISDNTTTDYTDNIDDATVGAASAVPTVDTAHTLTVEAQAEEVGIMGNVAAASVTELVTGPNLSSVTNLDSFTGGSEEEDIEIFRQRLLSFIQNPLTGSAHDLEMWAENINGVEKATAFTNTPDPGTVTILISGPGGATPDAEVIAAVQEELDDKDLCNITIVVGTFSTDTADVDVTVVLDSDFTLDDVTPSVITGIQNYINSLDFGATLYVSGIVDAVFGLSGIVDVVVTTPGANAASSGDDYKWVPGTITVGV